MINPTSAPDVQTANKIAEIHLQLQSGSNTTKFQLIQQLAEMGEAGLTVLMEWLLEQKSVPANALHGKAYQVLTCSGTPQAKEFVQTHFPTGIVPLQSEREIDYSPLQKLLAEQDFQAADSLTLQNAGFCSMADNTHVA